MTWTKRPIGMRKKKEENPAAADAIVNILAFVSNILMETAEAGRSVTPFLMDVTSGALMRRREEFLIS